MFNTTLEGKINRCRMLIGELNGAKFCTVKSFVRLTSGELGTCETVAAVYPGDYILIDIRDEYGTYKADGTIEEVLYAINL